MIGNPIDKRRAERFAELVDASRGGPRRHRRSSHDEELAGLVELSEALHETAENTTEASAPRPEFQAALRQRLLAVAATQGIGATATAAETTTEPTRRPLSNGRRMVVAGALAVGVLGLSGVSTASADALPGDALYPVKRSAERAQLALAGSEVNRGQLYFEFARTRLLEAGQVIGNEDALNTALTDMDSQLASGMKSLTTAAVNRQDVAVLDAVDEFLDGQSPKLAQLFDETPSKAHDTVGDSMDLMDSAAERSQEVREALLCSAAFDDDADKLGPLPGSCGVLPGEDGTPLDPPNQEQSTSTGRQQPGGSATDGGDASVSQDPDAPSQRPEGSQGETKSHDTPESPSSPKPTGGGGSGGLLGEIGDALDDLLG